MPNSLASKFGFSFGLAVQGGSPVFGQSQQWAGFVDTMVTLANGAGAGQGQFGYLDERTLLTGANDDIDLIGILTDALGQTVNMSVLKALLIWNRPRDPDVALVTPNTTDLTIGGATNPFVGFLSGTTPKIGPIKPGGFLMLGAGHASGIGSVVAGTGDILRIANSAGATNKYVLGLIGG